jgi:hypothetical protein
MGLHKKINFSFIVLLIATFAVAQSKPASPAAVATGKINGATITINYSSPSVKGRVIWGDLVPFNKVWRAGANDATTFETDKDLTIEGSKLPAGKYSFFVIPNEKECVVIFNKDAKQWGAYKYKEKDDQIRVTVQQQPTDLSAESLIYTIKENSIVLSWEKWNIPIAVK